jgi:hypothetical protein
LLNLVKDAVVVLDATERAASLVSDAGPADNLARVGTTGPLLYTPGGHLLHLVYAVEHLPGPGEQVFVALVGVTVGPTLGLGLEPPILGGADLSLAVGDIQVGQKLGSRRTRAQTPPQPRPEIFHERPPFAYRRQRDRYRYLGWQH